MAGDYELGAIAQLGERDTGRRGAGHLRDHAGRRGAGGHRRLVDAADRLPEAGRLDAAVGHPRAGLRIDAADLPLPADDRRDPLLAAARHRPAART